MRMTQFLQHNVYSIDCIKVSEKFFGGFGKRRGTDEEGKDVDQDLLAMINHRKTNRCSEGNSFEVNHRGKEGKWID